jgi:hypothetical protein
VLISPKLPLSLERVAWLWATEINEDPGEVVRPLLRAYFDRKLKTSDTGHWNFCPDGLLEYVDACGYRIFPSGIGIVTDDPGFASMVVSEALRKIEITRDEFLRWVDEQGYTRPKFWDGHLYVGHTNPLSILEIACDWAVELHKTIEETKNLLLNAILRAELVPGTSSEKRNSLRHILETRPQGSWNEDNPPDTLTATGSAFRSPRIWPGPAPRHLLHLEDLRITREEFLRWINAYGHPQPIFWVGRKTPVETQKDENPGAAAVVEEPPLRQAPEPTIKEAIRAVYDVADQERTKPPNVIELAEPVQRLLAMQGLTASKKRIRDIADQPEFKKRRGPVGKRATR